MGFVGRGVFYLIVGACALWAAIYAGNNDISEPAITGALIHHPLGMVLVGAIGLAFAANAVWLLYRALLGRPPTAGTMPAWMRRLGVACLGLLFAGLALTVVALLVGLARPGNLHAISQLTGKALAFGAAGRIAVGVAGLIVVFSTLIHLRFAWHDELTSQLDLRSLGRTMRWMIVILARVGVSARAMVLLLVGVFLLLAAWQGNPRDAKGPTQSLRVLEYHQFGPWLLGGIATGLIAFGVYLVIAAWYRRLGRSR